MNNFSVIQSSDKIARWNHEKPNLRLDNEGEKKCGREMEVHGDGVENMHKT